MPVKKTCNTCKGEGTIEVLVHSHDTETETIICPECKGKKHVYVMSDDEEDIYHDDYW